MVVLAVLGVVVFLNTRGDQPTVATPGAVCTQGEPDQCLTQNGNNTGNICVCTLTNGNYQWDCSLTDTTTCPPDTSGAVCNPGETQTGDCGANGCAPGERPVQQCSGDGIFVDPVCTQDATCTTTTTSAPSCTITANTILEIGATCDPDFPYEVAKRTIQVDPGTTDTQCRDITDGNVENLLAEPGDSFSISDEQCGLCVIYELTNIPDNVPTADYLIAQYTGDCVATTSTTSTISSSSPTSRPTEVLPETGLADTNFTVLLAGVLLVISGISINRVWQYYNLPQPDIGRTYEDKVLDD